MIKNIVFDFGKVLVDYDFAPILASIFPDPAEREEFRAIFLSAEICNRYDKGDTPFHSIIDEYRAAYPKWDRQLQEFGDSQLTVMTGEVPGMREVLTRLKDRGYHLYGLTNWSDTIYPVLEKYDILRMMDGRVISSEEHLIKPDPQIYRRLLEKYSLLASECLFTDDKQVNVDGALSVGMSAILFKNAAQFSEELFSYFPRVTRGKYENV